jgi:hypothetical protein
MPSLSVLQAVFGLAMLGFGRRLYWLFIAGIGFALGFSLAARILTSSSIWILLAVGLLAGTLAALAAVLMNRLVISLAGFLVGGYLAVQVAGETGLGAEFPIWLLFICAGATCVLLTAFLYDWALVSLTSMAGAAMLVEMFNTASGLSLALFAVLVVIGLIFQARFAKKK